MTKKSDTPAIRFKGFTDTWEQRKLSEITDKVTEKNAGLQYVETFTNSAEFGIISQRDFFDHDIAKLGSLDGYYIVKNEDFVYNPRISTSAPVGPINRNKLGRTGVMSPLYTVFRPHDIDTTYLEYFFKCGYWHSFMNFNGDSGARSDRFSIRDNVFFQMPIPIPDIDEQRKIGELLTCLDNLIALHQRKYDKLTNVKKSMLEKMFPKNGSNVPEIRFKGFTEAWEQRKLGDIASDMVAGGDIDKDLILAEGQYPVIANALTGDGIVGYYDKEYRVNAPAVTVTGRGDVGHAKARLVNFTPVVRLLSVKSEHDVFFLENAINTLKIVIESTGVPQLTVPQLAKYEVAFPRQLDEEEHIGVFFKQLDHLITLHQRKWKRINFAVHTDQTITWEQRKLGELALFNPKDELPQIFEYVDLESVVGTEMLSHRTEVKSSAPSRAQRLAHTGDLFYQTVRPYQKNNYLFEKPDNNYVFSTGYAQMRPYVDGYFLLSLVQSERFVKVVLDNCTGTSYPAINANDLAEIEVAAPSDESEAQKIGTIFRSIDNLITLHQRELEKLKNIKKSCLENMFV